MRVESKQLKQRLKQETESRKQWQEISRKKEEDLSTYKHQLIKVTKEAEYEKEAHKKTQQGL